MLSGFAGDAVFHKRPRLAAGGTVANGYGLNMILLYHLLYMDGGLHAVVHWRMGEDGFVV